MLEPIIEETSEDEDNQNWPQYDNVWSSESETGSVIRIELHNDQDSISERDFACPAKRPRRDRDDLLIIEENISYKKYSQQRNDILAFNTTTQQQQQQQQQGNIITNNDNNNCNLSLNNTDNFMYYRNNKRFDDFYSDSDSLSYNSLSRSSSLIQFESLEKQLQAAELNNSSSLGNSSPSLLSIESNNITGNGNNCNNLDNNIGIAYNSSSSNNNSNNNHHHHGNNCNKNSISNNNCLRRFESSESGLHHQTYYDVNKIEFNNTMMFNNDNENDNDDDDDEDQDEDDEDEDEDDDENETVHYNLHRINKNSDSESSDNSILSHEERIPKPSSSSSFVYSSSIMNTSGNCNHLTINCNENRLYYNKGRSSVENLSEDSGYCGEHYLTGLSKIKSKSIPNFLRYNEKCLEQTNKIDDYDNYKSLETVISLKPQRKLKYNSNDETTSNMTTTKMITTRNPNRNCSKYCEYSKNENILDNVDDDDVGVDDDDDNDDTIDENKIYPTTATITTITTKSTNIPTRKIQNEKQRGEFNTKIDTATTTISTAPKRTYYKNNEENFSYQNQKQKHKIKSKQKQQKQQQQQIQNHESKNELMYNSSSYSNNNGDRGCRMTIEDQVKNKIYPKPNRRNQINDSSSPLFLSPSSSSSSPPPLVLGGSLAFTQQREFSLDPSAEVAASSSSSSTSSTSSFLYQSRKKTSVLLYRSSSLPDIRIQCDDPELLLSDGNNYLNSDDPHLSYDNDNFNFNSSSLFSNLCHKKNKLKKLNNQFTQVSSLPNDLNAILCDSISSERFNCNVNNDTNEINYDCEFDWNLRSGTNNNNNNKTILKSTINRKFENRSFIDTVNFNSCYSSLNQSAKILSSSLSSASAAGQNYMNASYNNLTLLDYSGRSRSNRNSFTMSDGSGNSKRNSREFEFSKGNFLLDEISSHFDKNLSILSDREHNSDLVSEFLEKEKFSICENQQKPIPPARKSSLQKEQSKTKKSSSSSLSATTTTTEIAPTTTIAIEKPPRKHLSNNINKTFDQDPTILKTNYTESLEKCNFDPKEISNTDLTELQISNHSTPIKRGFVASTPNLNAFQRNHDDIDDDNLLHVCSAHTSMNQLPNEKKLGILLSEGSRTSLCKGVSFCPIVSEIRWHEQSSEENTNPLDSLENMKTNQHDDVNEQENFVNDQETITIITTNTDEVDANNIIKLDTIDKSQVYINANNVQNTENKASPAELNEQQQQQERDELKLTLKPDGMLNSNVRFETESTETETESEAMKLKEKDKTVSNVLIVEENVTNILYGADAGANNLNVNDKERCAIKGNLNDNKQKIILNEKMLNCASVNKSDDQKRGKRSDKEVNSMMNKVISDNTNVNNNNNNNNNNNVGIKSATIPMMTSSTKSMGGNGNNKNFTVDSNTGTDILSAKFKAKPDEKHHKNGFLSRFTGGFRFSLRRKKKPSLSTTAGDLNTNENNTITSNDKRKNKKNTADGNTNMNKNTSGSNKSPDFIYIPLKGPLPGRQSQQYSLPNNNGKNRDDGHLLSHSENQSSFGNDNSHVLLGKPPLPKQPPRVVGVCEKVRTGTTPSQQQQQQQQKTLSSASFQGIGSGGSYRHALESHSQRSSSQPREIDERFLNSERQYYSPSSDIISYHQFNGAMNENGCSSPIMGTNNIITSLPPLPPTKCPITRPAGISIGSTIGPNGNAKIGLIETNLDTHETIISGKTRSLMELGPLQIRHTLSKQSAGSDTGDTVCIDGTSSRRPHKSMEFLLDKENQKNAMPPENELQKSHDSTAALSEHQLRVQASLQRLNIPDWFRQYSPSQQKLNDSTTTSVSYKPGSFTRKRASDSGRWAGLNSKTTSLSSLGSQRSDRSPLLLSPSAHSHHGGQIAGFSRWSTSHLNSTQTSPSVSTRGSFSRGNAINSSFISGHSFNSAGGGTSIRNSFRQPYLGWRSQEKLTSPRTPHERLASSLLSQKPPKPEPAVTPEIQTSIKEVTSAIVHYVNDQTNRTSRSRSTSPNSRKCWLESSFVGIRPVESPQTPTLDNSNCSFNAVTPTSLSSASTVSATAAITSSGIINQNQNQNLIRMNGVGATTRPLPTLAIGPERSPSSASLEDVLASLLGLPTDSYRSTGDSANEMMTFRFTSSIPSNNNDNNNSLQVDSQNRFRRRSEGDAQKQQKHNQQQQQQQQQQHIQHQQRSSITAATTTTTTAINQLNNDLSNENNSSLTVINQQTSRRVSLDSSESKTTSELLIKCRNTKCDQSANPIDAKKYYKSCHNCSHLYCSRECRRAHWEKHRKACLHSRVSNLCRQVLSSCKDDSDTLRHLSLLARKGYLSQGRGVVRVLFRSPENAEAFMKNGFQCLGEASYVRWPDLMPAEMGIELYSELLRLSTEYKPDSKMLIYVAICVVSEAPGTGTAPVKWERQLVSRCAKLKLCKTILSELSEFQIISNTNTATTATAAVAASSAGDATATTNTNLNNTMMTNSSQEQQTEILILTFNTQKKINSQQREMIITNIQTILNRRGVILRRHYPEIYQRLQNFIENQNDRFMPVTIHPRDTQTGHGFVCIIMPILNENDLKHLPASDSGNRVSIIDVGEDLMES